MANPNAAHSSRRRLHYVFVFVQVLGSLVVIATAERVLPVYLLGLMLLLPGSAIAAGLTWVLAVAGFDVRFTHFWQITDIGYLPVSVAANVAVHVLALQYLRRRR